jgi:hypothetical protein
VVEAAGEARADDSGCQADFALELSGVPQSAIFDRTRPTLKA